MQVSALAMDPSGARVVTGGYDYDVRLWDFAGMDSSLRTIRLCATCSHSLQFAGMAVVVCLWFISQWWIVRLAIKDVVC